MLSDIGLDVNLTKSEVSNVSCDNFESVILAIEPALPVVTVTERDDQCIIGAPIDINGCRTGVFKAVECLSTMSIRRDPIDAHPAFFLLRNCLSMPRLLFKLRSSPCYRLHAELTVRRDIAESGFHRLQRQFRRYWVATVNTSRRSRRSCSLLGNKCIIASLCILHQCH